MNITIRIGNNYGTEVYYPACDTANLFATMLGTKTLTPEALMYIKRLGYVINIMHNKPKLNLS